MSGNETTEWAGHGRHELRERWDREAVHLYEATKSTNDRARELAEEGAPGGAIVLAREQTTGKGRGDRVWHSPPDAGVYMSMVFRPDRVENPGLLPILAGLGIAGELDDALDGLEPAVKWPNDLVARGRKFGGVLSEAAWEEGAPRYLVIGVGVNVRPLGDDVPQEVQRNATAVDEETGRQVPLVEVADALVRGLEGRLEAPPASLDPPLLQLLDRYDWLRDRRVSVLPDGGEEWLEGTCVGVAPDGALLFRPDRGALRRLHSATVEASA